MHNSDKLTMSAANRNDVVGALRDVLGRDDSLLRCCAVRALEMMNADDETSTGRLVDLLLDEDSDVRMDAVVALGRMKIKHAAQPLLENLEKDPEGEIRIEVVKALSRISSPETVDRLIRCFVEDGYPDLDYMVDDMEFNACWEVQSSLMDALAEIGDSRAVEPLIELLESGGYEDLHESGFRDLAKLSGDTARQFLLKQLKQGTALARRRAASALSDLAELTGAKGATRKTIPADILSGLTNALADRDSGVRINSARALAMSGGAEALVPITALLNDPDMEVRGEVASILATTRGAGIVNRLHQLLKQDNRDLPKRIVRVLGEIGDPSSLNPVGRLLDSPDNDLLYEVVDALTNIGVTGVEQKLAGMLEDETRHYTLRMQAATALGTATNCANPAQETTGGEHTEETKAQDPSPEEVLGKMVFDRDERVACASLESLVKMNPDNAIGQLVEILECLPLETVSSAPTGLEAGDEAESTDIQDIQPDEADNEISPGLADMVEGQTVHTSTLAAILANQPRSEDDLTAEEDNEAEQKLVQPGVRILAIRLLRNFPEPGAEAVKSLIQACLEEDPELRREAILGLGKTGGEMALDSILNGLTDEQESVRLAALDALGNFIDFDGVPARLMSMLDDPDPAIRQRVVEQLTSLPQADATGYLCRALEDDDLGVCRTALNMLSRENYSQEMAQRIEDLMFRFSCELRQDAAAALRRVEDFSSSPRLLESLKDEEQSTRHWVCIDALAVMYSARANPTMGSYL